MSRFTNAPNLLATVQEHVPYVLFVDFAFDSGHVRLCSWDRDYSFGGNTYIGDGAWISVGEVSESAGFGSNGLPFEISGANTEIVTKALAEDYRGRPYTMYVGFADATTYQLVATPEIISEGTVEVMVVRNQGNTKVVHIDCENRMIFWSKTIGLIYSNEHQRYRIDSTDEFFNQQATSMGKTVYWGNQRVGVGTSIGNAANQIIGSFLKKMGFGFL